MSNLSIETTKRKRDGAPYWRTEFERIYVLAANKPRLAMTQGETVSLKLRRVFARCSME